jgi:cytochrome b6-f complex iron-sulfur subunit
MKISRRDFFTRSILASASLIALPTILSTFLESCNNQSTNPANSTSDLQAIQGTLSNGNIVLNIDSSSPLAKTGSVVVVNYNSGSILVDHPSANTFNALTSICTHQGCTINGFDSGSNQFVCPCHGSRFTVDGRVAQGPAASSLKKYQTQFAGNVLTIKIS